jgi:hypothetical protein
MTGSNSKPLDPAEPDDVTTFDMDAWIDDAKLPQRSMTVYRRADLRSRLDELEREIRLSEGGESSSADAGVAGLKAEWRKVAEQIDASAITITVRALTDDAGKQARADAKAENVKEIAAEEWDAESYADDVRERAEDDADIDELEGDEREALVRRRVVQARRAYIDARFTQAVAENTLVRLLVKPKMTVEQVRHLSEQIGSAQRDRLFELVGQAASDMRPITAPFSQPSSRERRGGTSSKRSGQQGRGASRR